MRNKLQKYFPLIRTREEVMTEIQSKKELQDIFAEWNSDAQEEFLNFVTGAKGVKMMYDFMSKRILDPELYKERVEDFLSLLMGQKVTILDILPSEENKLVEEYSILIMDMVVRLEDDSIVNLEIQKNGYMLPGQRSACYSADLLLRQYKRVRRKLKEDGKKMTYGNVKDVYTIVLFEKSPKELRDFHEVYQHHFKQTSDTGAEMDLLQKYLFVTLDNYLEIKHNKGKKLETDNRLEAWLGFMSTDDPEDILYIVENYPEFREMYEQVYEICRDLDGVMRMFSKELHELDQNSVSLMIDEMQKDLDEMRADLKEKNKSLQEKDKELEDMKREKDKSLQEKDKSLQEKDKSLQEKDKSLQEKDKELEDMKLEMERLQRELKQVRRE